MTGAIAAEKTGLVTDSDRDVSYVLAAPHGSGAMAWFRRIASFFALALMGCHAAFGANITCGIVGAANAITAGALAVPMNAPPGTVVSHLAPTVSTTACSFINQSPYGTSGTNTVQFSTVSALAPGFADVYVTTIAGLGVRYSFNAPVCSASNITMSNGLLQLVCPIAGTLAGPSILTDIAVTPIFVVYGAIKGGGATFNSVPIVKIDFFHSDNATKDWPQTALFSGAGSGTISAATCSVQTDAIAVPLPTVATRSFGSGINAIAGRQSFHLMFNCATGAQVSIVITDAVNPANRSTVLTPAPDSTAQGIGVQVLKTDGTPVAFGPDTVGTSIENQWILGNSPNGVLDVSLSAQYIRTGPVQAGSIRALATFTMSYN